MENFGNRDLSSILEKNSIIDSIYKKVLDKKKNYQPNPQDFVGFNGYTEESIKKEIDLVESYKKRWAEQSTPESEKQKKISTILESIIVDQFSGEWLSQKAEGHYTSEVDDVLRGVDVVAELKEDDDSHYLGFAIDVTMAKNPDVLNDKLNKNWKDVEGGKFPQIKYFEDADENKQVLSPIRVLIAVNPEFAKELVRLEFLKSENSSKKEELARHKFQFHLLFQIKEQLEAYYLYAQNKGDEILMDKLHESLRIFYLIISGEKEKQLLDMQNEVENEEDFKKIREYCQNKLNPSRMAA